MVTFNLLPWRQQKAAYEQKQIRKLLWTSAITACMTIALLQWQMEHQASTLREEVGQLEKTVQSYSSMRRFMPNASSEVSPMQIREKMLAYQSATKQLLTELGSQDQNKVCFTEISREKNALLFKGQSSSAEDLTTFLKNWKAAHLFPEIKIGYLQQKDHQPMQFSFQAFEENRSHEV